MGVREPMSSSRGTPRAYDTTAGCLRALSFIEWTLTEMLWLEEVVHQSVPVLVVVIYLVLLPLSTTGDGSTSSLVARVASRQRLLFLA